MSRHSAGTGYAGPLVNYDDMIAPESFVRRVVYGKPAPLLGDGDKMDMPFFGRLFDQLANAHVAYVKECAKEQSARDFACKLRKELPAELYAVGIHRKDPQYPGWHVFAYNKIERWMARKPWHEEPAPGDKWVDTREAARLLHVTPRHVRRLVIEMNIDAQRIGAGNRFVIPRSAIAIMSNRPHRWVKRSPKRT